MSMRNKGVKNKCFISHGHILSTLFSCILLVCCLYPSSSLIFSSYLFGTQNKGEREVENTMLRGMMKKRKKKKRKMTKRKRSRKNNAKRNDEKEKEEKRGAIHKSMKNNAVKKELRWLRAFC
jgi:hypothetical protein